MLETLTLKQNAFIRYLTDTTNKTTYNNGLESARAAGYKGNDRTLTVVASENLTKPDIKQAITDIEAKRQADSKNNQEQAILELRQRIAYLEPAAKRGNVQAIQAQTSLFRELNEVRGLHKQRFVDETEQQRELSEAQAVLARKVSGLLLRQDLALLLSGDTQAHRIGEKASGLPVSGQTQGKG